MVIDLPDAKTGLRELFPRYFFLVTNWPAAQRGGWELLEHYRRRGTFEDRLGEFNAAIGNGLSAGSFAANEASLLLKLLAFNLTGILRGELEGASGCGWDLKRVQHTVLKAGAAGGSARSAALGSAAASCSLVPGSAGVIRPTIRGAAPSWLSRGSGVGKDPWGNGGGSGRPRPRASAAPLPTPTLA